MRPLSLSPLTVHPCSPQELVRAAAAAGFEQVGLRVFRVMPTDADVMGDEALQQELLALVRSARLDVLDVEVVRLKPDMDVAALDPALAFAAAIGGQWLAVTTIDRSKYKPEDEPGVVESLARLADRAALHGLRVMLEFMAFRGVATLQDAVRVVTAAGRPNIGITLDALHFFRSGGSLDHLDDEAISLVGFLQLCDARGPAPEDLVQESRYGRYLPGRGQLPLVDLLKRLPASIPTAVEAPSPEHSHLSPRERAHEARHWTNILLQQVDRGA